MTSVRTTVSANSRQNGSPAWTGGLGFGSGQRIWGWILGSRRLQSGLAGGRLIDVGILRMAVIQRYASKKEYWYESRGDIIA